MNGNGVFVNGDSKEWTRDPYNVFTEQFSRSMSRVPAIHVIIVVLLLVM